MKGKEKNMRIIAVSDLHLGRTIRQVSLIEDQRFALMKSIVPLIKEKKADVLLIAGDIFDTYNPSNEAMALYDEFLNAVHALGTKIIAIGGNHDSPMRVEHHQKLLSDSGYYVSASYDGALKKVTLTDEYGPVNFYLMPYLTPADVKAVEKEKVSSGTDFDEAIRIALGREKIDSQERNVLLAHQAVMGATRDFSDIRPLLMMGANDYIRLDAFDAFDYVALGHIHKKIAFAGGRIAYPGALLPYEKGESNQRFVSYVELGKKGEMTQSYLPTPILRQLLTVRGTYDEILAKPSDHQNYVIVSLTDKTTSPTMFKDFERKFPKLLTIESEDSAEGKPASDPQGSFHPEKSPLESIDDFYRSKTGKEPDEEMKKLFAEILGECEKEEKSE
jgi:exonuclease SbcD